MTTEQRNRIIKMTIALLEEFIEPEEITAPSNKKNSDTNSEPTEMLTVRECTDLIQGLTAYTVRRLASRGKIISVRAGEGKHGKILINKNSLLDYINSKKD